MKAKSKASLKGYMEWVNEQYDRMKEANRYLDEGNKLSLFFRGVSNCEYDTVPAIYGIKALFRTKIPCLRSVSSGILKS